MTGFQPVRRSAGRLFDNELNRMLKELFDMGSDTAQAERVVLSTFGDTVSVADKGKNLNKFGRTSTAVDTTFRTVAQFQDATTDETFVTTNLIDSIVSTSGSDTTQTIRIEGHTIDVSGNLTFVVQTADLNGQTEVTLTTPIARATRASVDPSGTFGTTPTALAGDVAIYDNADGIVSGKPSTDAAVKLMILAGETQSQKATTAISSTDYFFISYFSGGISGAGGNAARVTFQLQRRDVATGGAWVPLGADIVVTVSQGGVPPTGISPYLIVPKNHDVRVVAQADSNTAQVTAEFGGFLAVVQ